MLIKNVDELRDFRTMAGLLEALEGVAEEILDDVILEIDLEKWCHILEEKGKVSDGESLWNIVKDSEEWGTFNQVLSAFGVDEGEDVDCTFPLTHYLAAFYYISSEETRQYIYDVAKGMGGTEDSNSTYKRIFNELFEPLSDDAMKACESWESEI